jgi:hypothetical protein
MRKTALLFVISIGVFINSCLGQDTNAPMYRFHPELANFRNITTPVLTNSPLLGLSKSEVSNQLQSVNIGTNDTVEVRGFVRWPTHTDYIYYRCFLLSFTNDRVAKVEVIDRQGGCVIIESVDPRR